jgi:hypothetical protein
LKAFFQPHAFYQSLCSRDSWIGIVTRLRARQRNRGSILGSVPLKCADRLCCLFTVLFCGYGVRGGGDCFPGGKMAVAWEWQFTCACCPHLPSWGAHENFFTFRDSVYAEFPVRLVTAKSYESVLYSESVFIVSTIMIDTQTQGIQSAVTGWVVLGMTELRKSIMPSADVQNSQNFLRLDQQLQVSSEMKVPTGWVQGLSAFVYHS